MLLLKAWRSTCSCLHNSSSKKKPKPQLRLPGTAPGTTPANSAINANSAVAAVPNSTAMASSDLCWSSKCLWALFVLGWLFPPLWWAGAAAGLKSGQDRQCLIVKRKRLSPKQVAPWRANVLMSLLSAVVLIVVLASYYGQLSTAHEGECLQHKRSVCLHSAAFNPAWFDIAAF